MDSLSFSLHDIILFLPVLSAGIAFWVKLNKKQTLDDKMNEEQGEKLRELQETVKTLRDEIKACSSGSADKLTAAINEFDKKDRDVRAKMGLVHERANVLEKEMGEIKGWKAAVSNKIDKI